MPEVLFKTSGKGGTHTKVRILVGMKKQPEERFDIFMAEADGVATIRAAT